MDDAGRRYCKLLDLNEIVVRCYTDNKSLTLNGTLSEEIKSQLQIIANPIETEKQMLANVEDEDNFEADEVNSKDVGEPSSDKLEDKD